MAMDASRLGQAILDAYKSVSIPAGTEINDADLLAIQTAVAQAIIDELGFAEVAPGTFANSGGAVAGVGGPIS